MKKIEGLNDIDELIIDYITGQLTPDKFDYLNLWIAASKENRLRFRELQEIWYASTTKDEELFDKELAYNRFQYRVKEADQTAIVFPSDKFHFTKKFLRIAATLAILTILGAIYLLKGFSPTGNAKDEFYTITVPYGAKSKVTLPDSTKVWLNAGTTIRYSHIAKDKIRRLQLMGKAYFEVAKMKGVPFIVETDRINIKVLGTKFNVVSYLEDVQISVTLLEGSIALRTDNNDKSLIQLVPNKCATYHKGTGELIITEVDAAVSNQWSQGVITFDAERLDQIANRLEREYNVKINIVDPSINASRFYGVFNRNQSIKEVFDIITLNNKLHYRMKGDTIQVSVSKKN